LQQVLSPREPVPWRLVPAQSRLVLSQSPLVLAKRR
jgi:hypothetical protein